MTQLKRDKATCLQRLVKTKDGGVSTRAPCRIHIPKRWFGSSVGLGSMTDVTTIYGFFPIIFEDNVYTVMNVCAMMDITPSRTTVVTVEDEEYFEFHFDAGVPMIKSLTLVRQDTLTFNVLDEFIMKGKAPWWTTVDDLCMIFSTADKHAGSKIYKVPQTIEFLVSIVSRQIAQRSRPLRQTAADWDDFRIEKIEFVPLKSVLESVNNTFAKLSGAYFHNGVISAITEPTTKPSKIEKILRA